MTEPVHRTLLLFDIEKFGQRDDVEQQSLRRMLYSVTHETLDAAGVGPDRWVEDRGDGLIVLISPEVSKVRVLRALLTETPALLRANNRLASSSTQIRVRVVLASGEVATQEIGGARGGLVGWDLNQAFRLLDGGPLRTALAARGSESVLCVSESVYQGTVRHGYPGVPAEEFHRISVPGKEGPVTAWLHGRPTAADGAATVAPAADEPAAAGTGPGAGVAFTFHGGSPSFGGSLVAGDQYGVSGGHVTGDVILGGGTNTGERP